MSIELSPAESPRDRRGKGKSRGDRNDRDNRRDSSPRISLSRSPRRKSRSPRRKSRSPKRKSRSPKRKEKRSSASPRRRRKSRKSSRSPKRKDRGRKDRSRSPRRRRRSRSPKRRRSGRKGRHSRRSKKDRRRRHDAESSTSRSPVRSSRRRRGYSSTTSTSSSSSESVYSTRSRRRRKKSKRRRPVFYRIGDEVEFKKSGGRRRRSRWVPAQVDEIHRGGMYGELTYSIHLLDSGKIVDYVKMKELRFRYPLDLERRLREEEIARCREDMRQINLQLARQQRARAVSARGHRMNTYYGGRGRSRDAVRSWHRARSAERNNHILSRPDRLEQRAQSVPPGSRSWPEFLAEFTKAVYGEPKENHDYSDHNEFNDVHPETGNNDLEHRGVNIDEMEYKRDVERTPPINDMNTDDRWGYYKMGGKDLKFRGSDMNFNIYFPPCRGHQGGNDLGG